MGNRKKIAEYHPATADFRTSELIGFRGDILSYWANRQCDSYSTDAQGFRHSTFRGKTMSVVDCIQSERYGVVMGASNIFGVGLAGNENVLASLLAERCGFPFANMALPGANSRSLNALLIGLIAGARQPPAVVVLSNGGDLANFCESGMADPVFGSPNRMHMRSIEPKEIKIDPDAQFERMATFSALWTSANATLCRMHKTPLIMIHQSTIFEKRNPTATEIECGLGTLKRPGRNVVFSRFRAYNSRFFARRAQIARKLGIPLAGVDTEKLTFIDEFHLDREGTRTLAKAIGDVIEPLLSDSKPKAKKAKA
jgi:hypothetical protein